MCREAWIVPRFPAIILMLKSLQRPLRGLLALIFLLTAAPASQATFDSGLYDSLLKKIYRNSRAGDAGDIYNIIRKTLDENSNEGQDLVDALLKKLQHTRSKLAKNVSRKDLMRVKKKLHDWLSSHRSENHGNISTPESATTAH